MDDLERIGYKVSIDYIVSEFSNIIIEYSNFINLIEYKTDYSKRYEVSFTIFVKPKHRTIRYLNNNRKLWRFDLPKPPEFYDKEYDIRHYIVSFNKKDIQKQVDEKNTSASQIIRKEIANALTFMVFMV